MNIGKRWIVLAFSLALITVGVGMGGQVGSTNPTTAPTGSTVAKSPVVTQVLNETENITVDLLVVSNALTAFASEKAPANRAVQLNIAKTHVGTAWATADAIPDKAMLAVGSTTNVRDSITRTLLALGAEVDATIACEKVRTPSCGSAAMVTRQSTAGAAAGAAVVVLMQAVNIDRKFVGAASALVQQDLAVTGVTTVDTAALRLQALKLAPNMTVSTQGPPAPSPAVGPPATPATTPATPATAK